MVTDMTTSTETYCETYDETIVIESAPPTLIADVVTQVFGNSNVIEALATGISEYEYSLDGIRNIILCILRSRSPSLLNGSAALMYCAIASSSAA